jgi:hypothetical protein
MAPAGSPNRGPALAVQGKRPRLTAESVMVRDADPVVREGEES